MPMLDVQRRWAESFRIRLGEKKISRGGKSIPASLDGHIRVTSASAQTIDAIAKVYGGVTSEWEGQHQLIFPGDHLNIVVLPGEACVGWWEQWRRKDGGMPVCTHRCDGVMNHAQGAPCSCPSVEDRLADREHYCQPTTRLWFMLPDVEVIGAGRLETHGIIAAETLPQSVQVLQGALSRGEMVPAVLRVVKVESSGKSFVVPRIEVTGVSLDQLLSGGVGQLPAAPPSDSLSPGPAPLSSGALRESGTRPLPSAQPDPGGSTIVEAMAEATGVAGPTNKQIAAIRIRIRDEFGITDNHGFHDKLAELLGRPVDSVKSLTQGEVDAILSRRQ